MKNSKIRDQIFTIVGFILAIAPYFVLGAYSAYCADALVTDDNEVKELILMGLLILLGAGFLYLHIIIHEAGHLLGGLLSGWSFLSFRVGNLVLIRKDRRLEWKKTTIIGTGGQCLMVPPQGDYEKVPFFLYLFSGGAANLLISILTILMGIRIQGLLGEFFIIFSVMGIGLGLLNLFPTKLGGMPNDGYHIFLELPGNKEAKKYLWCLMEINGLLTKEESTKAIPEEIRNIIFSVTADTLSDSIGTNLLLYKVTFLQEEGREKEAEEICQKIVNSPHSLLIFKNEARCELLYYEIMGECREEKIKELYNKKLQKYIKATALYPARKRLMYSYYLIYKDDMERAKKEYQLLLKVAKTHPVKAECLMELREAERIKACYEEKSFL